jgi:hypothetical protein
VVLLNRPPPSLGFVSSVRYGVVVKTPEDQEAVVDIGAPETEREIEVAPVEEPVPAPLPVEQPVEEPAPA